MPQVCQLGGRQRCNIKKKSSFEQCEDVVQNKKRRIQDMNGYEKVVGDDRESIQLAGFPDKRRGEKNHPPDDGGRALQGMCTGYVPGNTHACF